MTDRDPASSPVMDISPEPSPDELAALSVAILALAGEPAPSGDPEPELSAWRTAALRDSVLGRFGGAPSGWGRPRSGWRA